MRISLLALHGGSSIPLFCFRPLFRRSRYYAHQRDRSPVGLSLSFDLCRAAGTNSWAHCDELVLLVFVVIYRFHLFVLFVVQESFFLTFIIFVSIRQIFHAHLLFTRLHDVLSQLEQVEQKPSRVVPRLGDNSNTSGNESVMGEPRRQLRSKRRYKMKKAWGASDVGQFFVNGPTDVATKQKNFYCRNYRKYVFVLIHGHHEILRNFHGSEYFRRDQRLRLLTPGGEVLGYEENAMSPAEAEWQREKLMRAPLVVRGREYPYSRMSLSTRVAQWTRILGLCRKFPPSLTCCVWVEDMNWCTSSERSLLCVLSASTLMLRGHATRSLLVFTFAPSFLRILCASSLLPVLVHHTEWDVSSDFVSLHHLGEVTR